MTNDRIFRWLVKLNIFVYRATRGLVGANARGMQHLIITTTGARTGRPRTQALTTLIEDDTYFVIASNSGKETHPAWWHNLNANPVAQVQFGARVRPMRARTLQGPEREAVWQRMVEYNYRWQDYQDGVSRELPLVELKPAAQ